jgi:hypothetical protein
MARLRIIILDSTPDDADTYRVVLWADVPLARQSWYAQTGAVSAWKDALAADNTAIANGSVAETVSVIRVIKGSGQAARQQVLQDAWTQWQTFITQNNPWQRYGSTWDGTTWTNANNQ